VIAIADAEDVRGAGGASMRLVRDVPEWLSPLTTVIPGQLAAVRLAQLNGSDLDSPHGLSKITLTL
jgi:glucosamine--fructose-6-phosphate aminotransferase (isomerizing)